MPRFQEETRASLHSCHWDFLLDLQAVDGETASPFPLPGSSF